MPRPPEKIIVATTVNPFVAGGATYIVDSLSAALESQGHRVETLRFPFSDEPNSILAETFALRLIDLSGVADRLIAIRTPSHVLRHPNKVVWFIHHYRPAYDLWETEYRAIPHTSEGFGLREAIVSADNVGLGEARAVFCNSAVVQKRLAKYNSVQASVLYPPLWKPAEYHAAEYGDFFLYFSRLTHHKRQWLVIESMRHTTTPVKVVIAGAPDPGSAPYVHELQSLVEKYSLADRVNITAQWIDHQTKVDLFSRCLAAIYLPFDEDSYGYPSLEAHASGKAVLTTTDSGGTLELIEHGRNGIIVPPEPELIAVEMDNLYRNRLAARQMGVEGAARVQELGISWENVVGGLLA